MRVSEYSQAVADDICTRLAEGESLRAICRDEHMPAISTVFKWLGKPENAPFVEQYARAREAQAETFAHEIVEIADDGTRDYAPDGEDGGFVVNHDHIARSRLRVEARKWVAARILPKKYGDKIQQEVTGKDGGPVQVDAEVAVRPTMTREEWLKHHGLG